MRRVLLGITGLAIASNVCAIDVKDVMNSMLTNDSKISLSEKEGTNHVYMGLDNYLTNSGMTILLDSVSYLDKGTVGPSSGDILEYKIKSYEPVEGRKTFQFRDTYFSDSLTIKEAMVNGEYHDINIMINSRVANFYRGKSLFFTDKILSGDDKHQLLVLRK